MLASKAPTTGSRTTAAYHPAAPCLQPLSMRNYPFDVFVLETQMTLTDTSKSVAGHPGLQLVPSAVSLEVRAAWDRIGWVPRGMLSAIYGTEPEHPVESYFLLQGVNFARNSIDLTNGWNLWHHPGAVTDAGLELYRFNRSAWYQVSGSQVACTTPLPCRSAVFRFHYRPATFCQ